MPDGAPIAENGHVGDALELPTGTVTLLFTDIEGSTRLLAALGDGYVDALNAHRVVVRRAIAQGSGWEVDTQGDAFFAVFADADNAVAAAVAVQRDLVAARSPVRVRIGVHTGTPSRNEDGYVGLDLHRGARICAAGHGGQVVLSATTSDRLARLPEGVGVRPLGTHLLKDLPLPMPLSDLVVGGLPSSFPPLRSLGSHPTNLPRDIGDLLGRARELDAAAATLADGARLLTLTGPGGTGKTTLATHLAARLRTSFADGVFVVWLAQAGAATQVAAAIAGSLGLRERPGMAVEEVLHDYLRNRSMLLLLDNFEHVVDAAPLLDALLSAAPGVQVVVTSRMALRLRGEVELRVPPLELTGSPGGQDAPAVELFVARARQAQPGLDPDPQVRTVVAEICRRLDGLPLAIELAAARTRLLPPAAMLARLDRPFEVASGGPRHVDKRQQTLRATIAWSYGLLDPDLQRAFARVGVFASPFSLEAAEEVCEVGLDDLAQLLDQSLLRPAEGETGRLAMLGTIRAFAVELLDVSDDRAVVRARHAAWAARLAAHGGPAILDGEHERYLARFDAEQEELRTALDWLVRSGEANAALTFAADLAVFWETRGQWTEGRARLEEVLAAAASSAPPERDRARALFSIGRLAMQQRDLTRSRSALAEALSIFRRVGDARDVVVCQSHIALESDDHSWALAALELARQSGDPWALGVALNNLADSIKTTDPERAGVLLSECLDLRRALGEKRTLAITLGNIGDVQSMLGNADAAYAAYQESLTAALDIGLDMMIADVRLSLARMALGRDRADDARILASDAFDRAERIGDPEMMTRARSLLDEAART